MVDAALKEISTYRHPLRIMEVCGTHTSVIEKSGLRSLLPDNIKLVSGPGCPVCVTPRSYIDALIGRARQPKTAILSFGDMLRVPGRAGSLAQIKACGADVRVIYSPFDVLRMSDEEPDKTFIVAAVGFETTAPAFALLAREIVASSRHNVRLLTALKTMPPALQYICENENHIDAFICPGNVSVIIGSDAYTGLAQTYGKPFVVAGFTGEHIIAAVYEIVRQLKSDNPGVANLYRPHVHPEGNEKALAVMQACFNLAPVLWRGIGMVEGSALVLNKDYEWLSAGQSGMEDDPMPPGCACADVILGRKTPSQCTLFKTECTPETPVGPCMVSAEGACGIRYNAPEGVNT